MGIAKHKPTAIVGPAPIENLVQKPMVPSILEDNQYVPTSSLLAYVEGSSWIVEYFSQVLDLGSELREHDSTQIDVYQQYKLIKGLELKVTSALSPSQDEETKRMVVSGTANVYPFVIPNTGDMFIAPVGDGHDGLFTITSSERKSYRKNSVYEINYVLLSYVNESQERIADLYEKATSKYYYRKDYLVNDKNPLLEEQHYVQSLKLEDLYQLLITHYFENYIDTATSTIIIPDQDFKTYDPFLIAFLHKTIESYEAMHYRRMRVYRTGDDPNLKIKTVFDAMLYQDTLIMANVCDQMCSISTWYFNNQPMMESIRFSHIEQSVYPTERYRDIAPARDTYRRPRAIVEKTLHGNKQTYPLTEITGITAPIIYGVFSDGHYVFSRHFYEGGNLSHLEIQVKNMITDNPLDATSLITLLENARTWEKLEQIYYIPVLLWLVRYHLSRRNGPL